jgi:hypothetical protein
MASNRTSDLRYALRRFNNMVWIVLLWTVWLVDRSRSSLRFHYRHGLRKALLSSYPPGKGALSTADACMTKLEKIKDWDAEFIKATNLDKLLKNIIQNNQLPRHGEYNFRERAQDLAKRLEEAESQRRATS